MPKREVVMTPTRTRTAGHGARNCAFRAFTAIVGLHAPLASLQHASFFFSHALHPSLHVLSRLEHFFRSDLFQK